MIAEQTGAGCSSQLKDFFRELFSFFFFISIQLFSFKCVFLCWFTSLCKCFRIHHQQLFFSACSCIKSPREGFSGFNDRRIGKTLFNCRSFSQSNVHKSESKASNNSIVSLFMGRLLTALSISFFTIEKHTKCDSVWASSLRFSYFSIFVLCTINIETS